MIRLRIVVLCLIFSLLGVKVSILHAQTEHYFLEKTTHDTITNYKLIVYHAEESAVYKPSENHALYMQDGTWKSADSLVLHYDSWYQDRISIQHFDQTNIYVDKHLSLGEVQLENKTQTIGTHNKAKIGVDYELIPTYQFWGEIVTFELPDNTKGIQDFQLRIKRKERGEASIMPVLFMADSINDPNKIYLYPEIEPYLVDEELTRRYQWISIPIKNDLTVFKKLIFAGFYGSKKDKVFYSFAEAKANTFLEDYRGRVYLDGNGSPISNDGTLWSNRLVYRSEDFYIPAVKLELVLY